MCNLDTFGFIIHSGLCGFSYFVTEFDVQFHMDTPLSAILRGTVFKLYIKLTMWKYMICI